jgi:hypothetical protein
MDCLGVFLWPFLIVSKSSLMLAFRFKAMGGRFVAFLNHFKVNKNNGLQLGEADMTTLSSKIMVFSSAKADVTRYGHELRLFVGI